VSLQPHYSGNKMLALQLPVLLYHLNKGQQMDSAFFSQLLLIFVSMTSRLRVIFVQNVKKLLKISPPFCNHTSTIPRLALRIKVASEFIAT
jgi:hypothetical protein